MSDESQQEHVHLHPTLTNPSCSYRECSYFNQKCGNLSEAIRYAKEELEIELYCMGTDPAAPMSGLGSAKCWLEQLETDLAGQAVRSEAIGNAKSSEDDF